MTADVGTAVATNANTRVVVNGNANTISPEELQRIARENAENEKRQKELADFGKKLETPDAKITLDEAKQKLALIKSREERFFAQTVVAATLAKRGDKDSARVLLDEARSQLPSRPTFYVDCIKFAMVARAYIDVDAEQTFQMLDTLVFQLNDLLGGLVKFGEFLGGDSIVANGEFRFGMFGDFFGDLVGGGGAGFDSAPSFGAGRGNPLGGFQDDLIKLSIADFQRLQTTADKFERSEVRLTARMLILSSVLQDKDAADTSYRIQPSERY